MRGSIVLVASVAAVVAFAPFTAAPAFADDFCLYWTFSPSKGTVSGVNGFVDWNGDVEGIPGAEYLFFIGEVSSVKSAHIYRVETAGDPQEHNVCNPVGTIATRTFTHVKSRVMNDIPSFIPSQNAFWIDHTGIYYGPQLGIYHWKFDWTKAAPFKVASAIPYGTWPQTLAYDPVAGFWWTGSSIRDMYRYDAQNSTWVKKFSYTGLSGHHHDGLEIVNGSMFISDMTTDLIIRYELDIAGDAIQPAVRSYSYTAGPDVEGMGYGPNRHIWISGWSAGTILELGGGELQFDLPPEPINPCCWTFNDQSLGGWLPGAPPDDDVTLSTVLRTGSTTDYYMLAVDDPIAGLSTISTTGNCDGDWAAMTFETGLANFSFEIRIIDDGLAGGDIYFPPTFIITNGSLRAKFVPLSQVSDDNGSMSGWHTVAAPIYLVGTGPLPSNSYGYWIMLDGTPDSYFDNIIRTVQNVIFPVQANNCQLGLDNICLVKAERTEKTEDVYFCNTIAYPDDWVRSGEEVTFADFAIHNLGSDTLHITDIYVNEIQGPAGFVEISPTSMDIDSQGVGYFDVVLNPGGYINAPGTSVALEAEVFIESNDPDEPLISFPINTVVTDTVEPIAWDTVVTGMDIALAVANNGNAGNICMGGVNMDYSRADECQPGVSIYLSRLTPIIMHDANNYSWTPLAWERSYRPYNLQPVTDVTGAKKGQGAGFDQYRTNTFVSSDSAIGGVKHWVAPGEQVSYVIEKWEVFSFDGLSHTGVAVGEWIDWDIPADYFKINEGDFVWDVGQVQFLYQYGYESGPEGCMENDRRFGASGLLGYYTSGEYASDTAVNHTGIWGAHVLLDSSFSEVGVDDTFLPDSVWGHFQNPGFLAASGEIGDMQMLLNYGFHDILPGDTLVIWTIHASVYDGDLAELQAIMDSAYVWYRTNRSKVGEFASCGQYTGGITGNANCSTDGKLTLSDITRLIDRVYVSKDLLCCEANGNTNGSVDCKITLSDITVLIDAVYISKTPPAACMPECVI